MGPMVEEALQEVASIPEVPVETCFRNAQIAREAFYTNALNTFRLQDLERTLQPLALETRCFRGDCFTDLRCRRNRLV